MGHMGYQFIISFQLLETCPDIVDPPVEIQPTIHGTLEVSSHPIISLLSIKTYQVPTCENGSPGMGSALKWLMIRSRSACGVSPRRIPGRTPNLSSGTRPGHIWGLKMGYTMAADRYNYPQLWPFKWRT